MRSTENKDLYNEKSKIVDRKFAANLQISDYTWFCAVTFEVVAIKVLLNKYIAVKFSNFILILTSMKCVFYQKQVLELNKYTEIYLDLFVGGFCEIVRSASRSSDSSATGSSWDEY